MIQKFFNGQKDDEVIILVAKKHWLSILPIIVFSGVLVILGTAGLFLPLFMEIKGLAYNIYLLSESLIFLAAVVFFYVSWVLNYLSFGILTNERIIDIDQRGLFSSSQTAAQLESIEDVTANVSGLVSTILNVGTLLVMTAGEIPNIEFEYIKNPQAVAEAITKAQENAGASFRG